MGADVDGVPEFVSLGKTSAYGMYLRLKSRDPERYPERVAGVSYRDLNVHGFGSLTDYQKSVLLSLAEVG